MRFEAHCFPTASTTTTPTPSISQTAKLTDHLLAETGNSLDAELRGVIFDPAVEAVEQDGSKALLESSAVNFYAPDVSMKKPRPTLNPSSTGAIGPVEYGLNSRLEKDTEGNVVENVYKLDGLTEKAFQKSSSG